MTVNMKKKPDFHKYSFCYLVINFRQPEEFIVKLRINETLQRGEDT